MRCSACNGSGVDWDGMECRECGGFGLEDWD